MFMKSDDEKYCAVYCSCGCNDGIVLKVEKDEYEEYDLSIVSDKFYLEQLTCWNRFKEKCKRIWAIIRNYEYYYFGLCLSPKDMKEFKDFICSIEKEETCIL